MKPHLTFQLAFDGNPMTVSYLPQRFGTHDHFEFTHPEGCGKPIPVSRTGYLSHFVHREYVTAAGGPEAFAEGYCRAVLSGKSYRIAPHFALPDNQLSLF